MKPLELEALTADRESVKTMLAEIPDSDPVGRLSFEARLASIEEDIARLENFHEATGSVALMFAGAPVQGSRAIHADFAAEVLKSFQDLVTKRISSEDLGPLGSRGRVPERTTSTLSIRDLVRGSMGFVLEETATNESMIDTPVKKAISDVASVITKAAAGSDEEFESTVETLDPRMLISLRGFFRALDESNASVRIVENERDESLDTNAIRRARTRVDATEVKDTEADDVIGELLGLLPSARRFEMKLVGTGNIIRGSVLPALAMTWLELIESPDERFVGQVWRAKMKIREVTERNRPPRYVYTLQGLIERR
ncbi:MAG: hypothetical protein M0T84_15570 [Betaproteobacteria bacterium]|nr:hypothetical protein [Betaproteobacteria bacterium]